jgi:CheY-like chemotaxis protein
VAHKLLLADDSVTIQRVIELTFANEDVEVTAVADGQMAIDRLGADPPDIILADIDMPRRDGYEVAAYVKSRPELAHIPVVLLAGAFEPIDQARAEAAGSSDVLAKPFEPQMVINRVKELLGRKRADEDGAQDETTPSLVQPPPGESPPGGDGGQTVSLDDYFDQLDAAFSNLQPGVAPSNGGEDWPADLDTPAAAVTASPMMVEDRASQEPVAATPALAAPVEPVAPAASGESHAPQADHAAAAPGPPRVSDEAVAASAPVTPSAPVKPFSNPFATLSAARAEAAARPVPISDEVIDQIVSRVLQRISDRVVRETVTDIVSQTAERLVREEIERIRTEA